MKHNPKVSDSWSCGGETAFLAADLGDPAPETRMQVTSRAVEATRYTIGYQDAVLHPGYDWDKEGDVRFYTKPKSASYRMGASIGEHTDDILLPNGAILREEDWRARLRPKMDERWKAVMVSLQSGETTTALQILRCELANVVREVCEAP